MKKPLHLDPNRGLRPDFDDTTGRPWLDWLIMLIFLVLVGGTMLMTVAAFLYLISRMIYLLFT